MLIARFFKWGKPLHQLLWLRIFQWLIINLNIYLLTVLCLRMLTQRRRGCTVNALGYQISRAVTLYIGNQTQKQTDHLLLAFFVCLSYTHTHKTEILFVLHMAVNQLMKGAKWLNCIKINCKQRWNKHMRSADKHLHNRTSALPRSACLDTLGFRLQSENGWQGRLTRFLWHHLSAYVYFYVAAFACSLWRSVGKVWICWCEGKRLWERKGANPKRESAGCGLRHRWRDRINPQYNVLHICLW